MLHILLTAFFKISVSIKSIRDTITFSITLLSYNLNFKIIIKTPVLQVEDGPLYSSKWNPENYKYKYNS